MRVGVGHVHRIREHVHHVRIHGHGLDVCRLFGSDSLDGEHLGLRIGVDVVREKSECVGVEMYIFVFESCVGKSKGSKTFEAQR